MITIDDILSSFNDCKGSFPTAALASALSQQEALTPVLLSILEKTISRPQDVSPYQMDYLFALYLLSKFRETKAFPLVLRLAELPGEFPEELLGDCITEGLARFIVSTFDGDLDRIKQLIENAQANEWSRNSGLYSLLGLVALHHLPREDLIDYLRTLFRSPLTDDEAFATSLVNVSCDLYPEELLPEINEAFAEDKVDTRSVDKKWVNQVLSKGKDACLARYVYDDCFHAPIDDIQESMGWMAIFERTDKPPFCEPEDLIDLDSDDTNDFFYADPVQSYKRHAPKLGRNDPCFCGSGKKYKKCCLN